MVTMTLGSRWPFGSRGPRLSALGAISAVLLAAPLASSQTLNQGIESPTNGDQPSSTGYGATGYGATGDGDARRNGRANTDSIDGHRDDRTASSSDGPYSGSVFDETAPPLRKLGLMFDLGTMDGGMLALVYRPLPWLRVHGGGGTNGAGPGVRIGTVVSPFRSSGWSFSADGGHFFPGDVNVLFAAFAGSDYDDSHLLERFDYDFVNLQAGWEVERGDLMFFARGGIGLLWTQLPSDDLARIRNLSSFVDPDGSVEALLPSLKIGIIGFL